MTSLTVTPVQRNPKNLVYAHCCIEQSAAQCHSKVCPCMCPMYCYASWHCCAFDAYWVTELLFPSAFHLAIVMFSDKLHAALAFYLLSFIFSLFNYFFIRSSILCFTHPSRLRCFVVVFVIYFNLELPTVSPIIRTPNENVGPNRQLDHLTDPE